MGSLTAGPSEAVTILAKSAIPFIGLSSGNIAANGALTGITALPTTYANAFVFLPVGAVAPASVAGWYFCQFSAANAGTVFLDRYTAGVPAIPAAPTPVTAGAGAYVGDTGEEFGPTITVPAGAMGLNGGFRFQHLSSYSGTVGQKTIRARFSGNAGTIINLATINANAGAFTFSSGNLTLNRGIANSQVSIAGAGVSANAVMQGVGGVNNTFSAINTAIATTIVLSGQRNTATDNLIIEQFLIELLSDGT